jgi:hypothetical protein
MIMTPRSAISACSLDELAADVVARNDQRFSYFPVTAGSRYVGLLTAAQWFHAPPPKGTVRDHYTPLSEDLLVGEGASILDFITEADERPCRLAVSGRQINGLVCLSDMQKLPVRATLFAVVTGFELAMADLIRARFPDASWMDQLSKGRQAKIKEQISGSQNADGFVEALLFTQFKDKLDLIKKLREVLKLGLSGAALEKRFKSIEGLRNALAHANDYAATPDQQKSVAAIVREILEFQTKIEEGLLK